MRNFFALGYRKPGLSGNVRVNYFTGGMMMPGRNTEYTWSRMGYNGQAKDDEVYGKGNLNTAFFWEMDTRILRRWELDPVDQISISNYAVFGNNPIRNNDVLGNKVKNAIGDQIKRQENIVKSAQKTLDDAQSNGTSKGFMRKHNRELKRATNDLNILKSAMEKVDQMLVDYEEVDPKGFKRMNEYADANGKEVDILITYADYMPSDNTRAETNIPANSINVINSKTKEGGPAWNGTFGGDIVIKLYSNGVQIKFLANEFGDIDYFDRKVKVDDFKAFDKWEKTASDKYGRYLEPGGAGLESNDYQSQFEKKYSEYLKTKSK